MLTVISFDLVVDPFAEIEVKRKLFHEKFRLPTVKYSGESSRANRAVVLATVSGKEIKFLEPLLVSTRLNSSIRTRI